MSFVNNNSIKNLEQKVKNIEDQLNNIDPLMKSVVRQQITSNATTVTQAEVQFGLYTALCVDTVDVWKQNRIRFYSPLFHHPKMTVKKLPWAHCVSSLGGFDDCGATWVPPAGSTVCILFENGNRASPFYIGTTWHRNRGPDSKHTWGFNIDEYYKIWEGTRKGYLVGPDDGSQVLPPWNTENYNGYDLTSFNELEQNPDAQKQLTYPNIYGFKTPEKHLIKMVDGDAKCNRIWKRFELMSSRGNWIMMKDDHIHYAGQWANPKCEGVVQEGDVTCYNAENENSKESDSCNSKNSNSDILGGHPSTGYPDSSYYKSQVGSNPYFKHSQECRPYKGAQTPQNNQVDLPQSGVQIMSISGHTFVMDDSVEEPSGEPTWDKDFDFGCNDHFVGRCYIKSATGHMIELSDVEGPNGNDGSSLRGENNYIRLLSANGNKIELNDHTVSQKDCTGCPPNVAGAQRGIHLQTTSNHTIDMVDEGNEQCSPCRKEGGQPVARAKKAFVKIRTGGGLEMLFSDSFSQQKTDQQFIQINCPQNDNTERGNHLQRFQAAPSGPGLVFLRVGGDYIVSTYDQHITTVGDSEKNPSDMIEIISKSKFVYSKDTYFNKSDKSHIFVAKDNIMLLAGQDCSDADCGCGGPDPCFGAVLVYDYCTGSIRISDRVFASTSKNAQQVSIFQMLPFFKSSNC